MKHSNNYTPETILIDTYKHLNLAQNQLDQFINLIGSRQLLIHHLPDDIRQLVEMTLQLSPEKRKVLRLFLESLQNG
jgi:hypothetical protein